MKTNKKLFIFCAVMVVIVAILTIFTVYTITHRNVNIDKNTIMMSTTQNTSKSEFDNWLTDIVGVKWVPSYLIIDGKEVLGVINGGIGVKNFKEELDALLQEHDPIMDIREVENSNVYFPFSGGTANLADMLDENRLNIIEIHMILCKDCMMVDGIPGEYEVFSAFDEDGTPDESTKTVITLTGKEINETSMVRRSVSNAVFYRYYLRSDIQDIFSRYLP